MVWQFLPIALLNKEMLWKWALKKVETVEEGVFYLKLKLELNCLNFVIKNFDHINVFKNIVKIDNYLFKH